jgi:hypothetical protein
MSVPAFLWMFFRCLRWLMLIGAVVYNVEFMLHRDDHMNAFGQLLHTTEFWMFALPMGGLILGFFELMMRERAGLPRPAAGREWLPRKA